MTDGTPIDPVKPSDETLLHCQIYRLFPEANAVLHSHGTASLILARTRREATGLTLAGWELLKAFPGIATHETQVILPVGISFYTFQSLAYTIDLYRRRIIPARSLFSYATYVSFFPQLLAGPIERPGRLLQQVQEPRGRFDDTRLREGLYLILTGLFKKVIIADNFALVVDAVFAGPASGLSGWEVLVGSTVEQW